MPGHLVVCRGFGDPVEGGLSAGDFVEDLVGGFGPDEGLGVVVPSAVLLRNATPSVLHQPHIGRVLRSSCNPRGRRLASSRGRERQPGRCPLFGRVTYEMMESAWRPPSP